MFENHHAMYNVKDTAILWKYMSFAKFVNLLSGKLYLNRVDLFEDVFECHFPQMTKVALENSPYATILKSEDVAAKTLYISCFHESDYETAFMWNQYAAEKDGVAIQTTMQRLKESFWNTEEIINISRVHYLDYNKDFISPSNLLNLAVHKRKSFEAEREIRCICMKMPELHEGESLYETETPKGIKVNIDIDHLIDKVYLPPHSSEYLKEDVQIVLEKFCLHKEIVKSNLYDIK